MKNQTINAKRFGNYIRYNIFTYGKTYTYQLLGLIVFSFAIMYGGMASSDKWNSGNWLTVGFITAVLSASYFIGTAFPALRKKNKTMVFLQLPVSTFEKYSFEFLFRFISFTLIFPIVFYTMAELSFAAFEYLQLLLGKSTEGYHSIRNGILISFKTNTNFPLLVATSLIAFCYLLCLFVGSIVFSKNALVKTLGFITVVFILFYTYLFVLYEKLDLPEPVLTRFFNSMETFTLTTLILSTVFILFAISYSYFKLKEKEV